jgi:RNA polymerase sigma-70 factor (ECF subfamily)
MSTAEREYEWPRAETTRARRFRDAARPWLDDAYTLARLLLLDPAEAEAATHDGYLQALRLFDGRRGGALKPALFGAVRNACYARLAADGRSLPMRPRRRPAEGIGRLVLGMPTHLREAVALRDMLGLSYAEIAEVTDTPVEAVLARLARARTQLRAGLANQDAPTARAAAPPRHPALAQPRVLCGALGAGATEA